VKAGGEIPRRALLGALTAAFLPGCIDTAAQAGGMDLRTLDQGHRLLLLGKVQVMRDGDMTARVAIETNDDALRGYQLDASGLVIWIVPRPIRSLFLAWLSGDQLNLVPERAGAAFSLGSSTKLQMAPLDPPVPVVYFGTIRIDLGPRRLANLEKAAGYSRHETSIEVSDDAKDTLPEALARNPTLAGLDCYSLLAKKVLRVG
jgi:hypothetical protein